MVESASKGMILMYAKEAILKVLNKAEVNPGAPLRLLCQSKKVTVQLMPGITKRALSEVPGATAC